MGKKRNLRSHAATDEFSRLAKAKKIESILELKKGKKFTILDIGTGAGYIPSYLGKSNEVVSIDVNDERVTFDDYSFIKVDDEVLPKSLPRVDIIISNQVIEHIPNQHIHISEMYNKLKMGGKLYIATPNKWWLIDPHTKLPFINWLPIKLANFYSNKLKRGNWDVYPLSFTHLKRAILREGFTIEKDTGDTIHAILSDPSIKSVYKFTYKLLPKSMLRKMKYFYPSIVLVCKK